MAKHAIGDAGETGIRTIPVWDPLVRVIHWTVAVAVIANGFLLDAESTLHHYLGYTVLALVGLRLVWGLIGTRHARFSAFPPNPLGALRHMGEVLGRRGKVHLSHNPLGALMVYNLWATLLVICASGYMMGTTRFFGLEWVEELHETAFDWLMVSVVLHIAGVAIESRLGGVPLLRAMLDGKKRVPEGRVAE